jgi:hypothetical protein
MQLQNRCCMCIAACTKSCLVLSRVVDNAVLMMASGSAQVVKRSSAFCGVAHRGAALSACRITSKLRGTNCTVQAPCMYCACADCYFTGRVGGYDDGCLWDSSNCVASAAFFYLAILFAILASIPTYVMCCCSAPPVCCSPRVKPCRVRVASCVCMYACILAVHRSARLYHERARRRHAAHVLVHADSSTAASLAVEQSNIAVLCCSLSTTSRRQWRRLHTVIQTTIRATRLPQATTTLRSLLLRSPLLAMATTANPTRTDSASAKCRHDVCTQCFRL